MTRAVYFRCRRLQKINKEKYKNGAVNRDTNRVVLMSSTHKVDWMSQF